MYFWKYIFDIVIISAMFYKWETKTRYKFTSIIGTLMIFFKIF